jgi:hypothetical protein
VTPQIENRLGVKAIFLAVEAELVVNVEDRPAVGQLPAGRGGQAQEGRYRSDRRNMRFNDSSSSSRLQANGWPGVRSLLSQPALI